MKRTIGSAIFLVFGLFSLVGCSNPSTPAGYVGYVKQGAWFGKDAFYTMQLGPTSTGLGWLLDVQNVSITPYTYSEPMEVLSRDNLKVRFQTHIVWTVGSCNAETDKLLADTKVFVEKYSTLEKEDDKHPNKVVEVAYGNFLKEPLRTAARDEVQALDALRLKEQIVPIGKAIHSKIAAWVGSAPFCVKSVVVGDIQYPDEVAGAVAKKMATTQLLEQKATELKIEEQEKLKRIVQAEGIAKAMEIIQVKLTSQYLQHEAIEAQKAMVGSPNHTTIYIPVGPMGVPLVGNVDMTTTGSVKK